MGGDQTHANEGRNDVAVDFHDCTSLMDGHLN
jgi:hypothetical protein